MQLFQHPGEALTYFCKLIGGNDQKILFPSQSLYLKYYANVLDGIKLNSNPLILLKIIFSEIPTLNFSKTKSKKKSQEQQQQQQQDKSLFPYCQIFSNSLPIYNSLNKESKLQPYKKEDISLWFQVDTKFDGDILIRIRHFENENQRLPLFRILLHTGFVYDNVARFYQKDLDIARFLNVSENFFIDILFQQAPEEENEEEAKLDESAEKRPKKHSVDDIDFIINQIGRKNQEQNKEDQEDDSLIYKSRSSLYSNQSEEKEQEQNEEHDQMQEEHQTGNQNEILFLQEGQNNEKENQ
eukprot:TRINITY_DN2378_c0_g1_i12.p3 TRINITY_DN2378_c0_g1~~TRINITY_DN2378_c0_g1_i12.p3  ORF type:complete len:297 (-),score=54.67 TRINITY_DN2378_c0_g1_i12:894-1784(-)